MVKLYCSRVKHNPYREDMITEIPEKQFLVYGYDIADRLLEDLDFVVTFDPNGNITDIGYQDDYDKNYFESNFNTQRYLELVRRDAESILETGDEVDIPRDLKTKYFRGGINVAYIKIEDDDGNEIEIEKPAGIPINIKKFKDFGEEE